jgi:hypothetical protein
MRRLIALRNALCSGNPVIGIRGLAVPAFITALGAFLTRDFHQASLADFFGSMALSFTAAVIFLTCGLHTAHTKPAPSQNSLTELHLSR